MRLASRRLPRLAPAFAEPVEPRLLFHSSAPIVPVADVSLVAPAAPTVIDLAPSFNDAANRTRVAFGFDAGRTIVELYDDVAPLTVANFLNYVRDDRYENTVVHRAVNLLSGEPFVVQGGGYHAPDLNHIATDAPVPNEFRPNTVGRGTIAMAKLGGQPDSATSEWFFNLRNNADILDTQSGGFTSFGEVVGNGMTVVDAIAALPRITQPAPAFALQDFPVQVNPPATPQDYVDVQFIAELPELTTVTVDNPNLVTAVLQGTTLTLNYAAGATGTATVTVNSVDRLGGAVSDSFVVTVAAAPPESLDVPLGTGGSRAVTFTDADGTAATISVAGGTATVRFTGTGLSQQPAGRDVAVSGTTLALDTITVTGGTPSVTVRGAGGNGEVLVNGITAPTTVRSFSGRNAVLTGTSNFAGGVGRLDVLRTAAATIIVGGANSAVRIGTATDTDFTAAGPVRQLRAGSWGGTDADPDVITAPALGSFQVTGDFTGNLNLTGTAGARALNSARIGGAAATGTWIVSGPVGSVSAGAIGPIWSGNFAGPVNSFKVTGNLSGALTAPSVRSVSAGSVTSAAITLTQAPTPGVTNLGSLRSAGAVSGTNVRSNGNIGTVTAGSIDSSSIFAGVIEPGGPAVALPDGPDDFVPGVSIRAVNVRNRTAPSFVASYVAAASLGKLNLGMANTNNAGVPFGVAALDIASFSATDTTGDSLRAARLDDPSDSVNSGDAHIRVF